MRVMPFAAPIVFLCRTAALVAGAPPVLLEPPPPDYEVVDSMNYADTDSAQKAWLAASPEEAVSVGRAGTRNVLVLSCRFRAGSTAYRAFWDRPVRLNLIPVRGVVFRLFCSNVLAVSGFTFYFRSGEGWYAAPFSPQRQEAWDTIWIEKSDTHCEGQPAGWRYVDRIRIAAWRGVVDGAAEFALADLGIGRADPDILLIRNETAGIAERETAVRAAQVVCQRLAPLLFFPLAGDQDVDDTLLRPYRMVVLPHSPALTTGCRQSLLRFVAAGGRVLAFYTVPSELAQAVGLGPGTHVRQRYPGDFSSIRPDPECPIQGFPATVNQRSWNILEMHPAGKGGRVVAWWHNEKGENSQRPAVVMTSNAVHMSHIVLPDDPQRKHELLLAMAGCLVPDLWRPAAVRALRAVDDEVSAFPDRQGDSRFGYLLGESEPETVNRFSQAEAERRQAVQWVNEQRYPQAVQAAHRARSLFRQARGAVLSRRSNPGPQGEHRAFWCHSAFGVNGWSWEESVRRLAENGFTALFPHMAWAATAYYPSDVLPGRKDDQLALCLAACRRYGMGCHVWKISWNLGNRAPVEWREKFRQEGRLQWDASGKLNENWLCPSHPDNQALELGALVEVARRYAVDGLHVDYMRYPGENYCFCPGCRRRFEAKIGQIVKNWPADVQRGGPMAAAWQDFRRTTIHRVVEAVRRETLRVRPGIRLSAAVFPNWVMDRVTVAQDWRLWCERQWVDFVCPMNYGESPVLFESQVRRQRVWAGTTPVYPGIGLSTWRDCEDIQRLVEHIDITRQLKTGGFMIFQYGEWEARWVVPLCGLGLTRRVP